MAKPRKKLPDKSVTIYCKKCNYKLLNYKKGGTGPLVKCFLERISKSFTEEQGVCPSCNSTFGRETLIRGVPALKMVGGRVFVR